MKNLITLNPPKSAYGVAICDGTRDAKITFKASDGKTYTHLYPAEWLSYFNGKYPAKVWYSMVGNQPDIWTVMPDLEIMEDYKNE